MLLLRLSFAALLFASLATALPAHAQVDPPEPEPLPLLQPNLYSDDLPLGGAPPGTPSPCFIFGCINGAALDGNTVALIGYVHPAVYVSERDAAGVFRSQGVLIGPDGPVLTSAGNVLVHGDEIFVGGLVFRRSGETWTYQQSLPAGGLPAADRRTLLLYNFGTSASVFVKASDGRYRAQGEITLPESVTGTFTGPIALDGDTAIIAGTDADDGAVFVFQRFFSRWFFLQKLVPTEATRASQFGVSIAIDDGRIAVGASTAPGPLSGVRTGAVQTYERRGWLFREDELLTHPGGRFLDTGERYFGSAIALDGRRLVVSAPPSSPRGVNYDHNNFYYQRRGRSWSFVTALAADGAFNVELSGRTVLVDSPGYRGGTFPVIFDLPR